MTIISDDFRFTGRPCANSGEGARNTFGHTRTHTTLLGTRGRTQHTPRRPLAFLFARCLTLLGTRGRTQHFCAHEGAHATHPGDHSSSKSFLVFLSGSRPTLQRGWCGAPPDPPRIPSGATSDPPADPPCGGIRNRSRGGGKRWRRGGRRWM
eukprot:97526-Prorocentrum_minimum.AAC.1